MKLITAATLAAALAAAVPAFAQHHAAGGHEASAKAETAWTEGEIKKVEKDTGKVTIKHGPLTNLDMPGMTMVFRVKDPAMLDKVKAGDTIQFKADKVGGNFTVTELKPGH